MYKTGRTTDQKFYHKADGNLLTNVPTHEAFFSANETVGETTYDPLENVIIAVAKVGKGSVAYFGTHKMCDSAPQITQFLKNYDRVLCKDAFSLSCADAKVFEGGEALEITNEDLDHADSDSNSEEEEYHYDYDLTGGGDFDEEEEGEEEGECNDNDDEAGESASKKTKVD